MTDETIDQVATEQKPQDEGWEWAVVEVFGHRKHAGRTREEERFGAKLLRVDIPNKGDAAQFGWTTVYYGGSSIFSFSLSDEATVIRLNKPYEAASRLTYREPVTVIADEYEEEDEDGGSF